MDKLLNKNCCRCKEIKLLSEFNKNSKEKDGLRFECRKCQHLHSKIYRSKTEVKIYRAMKNRERYTKYPDSYLNTTLKSKYGITLNDYNKMKLEQNNKCRICNEIEIRKHQNGKLKRLAVDHCHKSGKVRGLLCDRCNKVLGLVYDNIELCIKLGEYIKKSSNNAN